MRLPSPTIPRDPIDCSYRHQASPEIWQETYLSAVLRAILYSDDPTYFLEAYRRLEPISTPDAEMRFLQAAEALFMKGATLLIYPPCTVLKMPLGVQDGRLDRIPRSRLRLLSRITSQQGFSSILAIVGGGNTPRTFLKSWRRATPRCPHYLRGAT